MSARRILGRMTQRRRFNRLERYALWLAARGQCERCGKDLGEDFEADHVQAFARGGDTNVLNGAALCRTCNRRKGSKDVTHSTNPGHDPYRWQVDALAKYRQLVTFGDKVNFFVAATPGAGKTRFALQVAKELLGAGKIERVVVVVPSLYLKGQWSNAADDHADLLIDPNRSNFDELETDESQGMAITYAGACTEVGSSVQRRGCRKKTLVIFDEVHHAGDKAAWGKKILETYEAAAYRLLLSGTPFRPPQTRDRIPFVDYDDAGRSKLDVVYGYGEALNDGNNVLLVFPSHNGDMEWWADGGRHKADFVEELSEKDARRRLRTAINPRGAFLKAHLRKGVRKLEELRVDHPNAAGLVIADNQEQAKEISGMLEGMSGEKGVLAIQDEPDSHAAIAGFAGDDPQAERYAELKDRKWLVAVQMVSEGVDIKRFRVVVYAAAKIAELFFYQVLGRVVRPIHSLTKEDIDQTGYVFIPADPTLLAYAEKIKEERDHVFIDEVLEDIAEMQEKIEQLELPIVDSNSDYTFLRSGDAMDDKLVVNGEVISPGVREAVQLVIARHAPTIVPPEYPEHRQIHIVKLFRSKELDEALDEIGLVKNGSGEKRFFAAKGEVAGDVDNLVKSLVNLRARKAGFVPKTDPYREFFSEHVKQVHTDLKQIAQGRKKSERTIDDLKSNLKWLEDRLREESE